MKNIYVVAALVAGVAVGVAGSAVAGRAVGGFTPKDWTGDARAFSAISVATSSDGETVYVGDLSGVWKSADGGRTWTELRKVVPAPEADGKE